MTGHRLCHEDATWFEMGRLKDKVLLAAGYTSKLHFQIGEQFKDDGRIFLLILGKLAPQLQGLMSVSPPHS